MDIVKMIEEQGTPNGLTKKTIAIAKSGEL
jgi:hypothetical protein